MHMTINSYRNTFVNAEVTTSNGDKRSEPMIPTAHEREVHFSTSVKNPCQLESTHYRAFYTDATTASGERILNVGYDNGSGVQPPADGLGEPNVFKMAFLEPTDNHGFYPISHAA